VEFCGDWLLVWFVLDELELAAEELSGYV